ncbi:NAD-dependent epimerase/dehydratase family protein [Sulfitobacter sp. SK012]|uniref:NAD-dependent epimerase/dehydratase family protein n=1 Tax=Sulfitobacter sp. SK012 TaxID=1389005 RepID=UPI0013B35854|nr:NAD-dependent epimerase/dehydratase family protein [Sulfitobacter sp. SK012]
MISTKSGEFFAKKRPVLLLGGAGRLGNVLRTHWPDEDDLVWQGRKATDALSIDILAEPEALAEAAAGARAVICLAGITPAYAARSGDALSLNVDLAMAAIRAAGPARVFLASSAAVYGAQAGRHCETDAVAPVSEYGAAKLQMEQAGLELGDQLGTPVTNLRIGNVAGADAILGGWREGMMIDAVAGATPRRSYIGPVTLARVMAQLSVAEEVPQTLNIAAPGVVAMGDLLDAAGLAWQPRKAGPEVIQEVLLDTARLETIVKFAPHERSAAGMVAQWRAKKENV